MRLLVAIVLLLSIPGLAAADAQRLESLAAVHEACGSVSERDRPALYAMQVEYRLGIYHEDSGRLLVDTRRNLRALDGRVSVLIGGLERVGFDVAPEQTDALRQAARAGARLELGFFLGFDEPGRQPCLVRNEHGVTIVRADLAYAELVGQDGARIARSESDRLRAWQDDESALAIPGQGPRGAVFAASFDNAQPPPEPWQRTLSSAAVRARIGQCHAEGIAQGSSPEGQVVVRMNVETRSGRVRRSDVAISSLGNDAEAQCIARALGSVAQLPPAPPDWRAEAVDLSVPVRVVAD
jgi:hypothetical protein